jgi:hypothetical protein
VFGCRETVSSVFSGSKLTIYKEKKIKKKNENGLLGCTYMRRLRGNPRDSNSETKFRTEPRELRSSGMTTISESGNSATIRALVSSAALMLRAGRTSLAPRMAKTRAVSAPIPDVAPDNQTQKKKKKKNILYKSSLIL